MVAEHATAFEDVCIRGHLLARVQAVIGAGAAGLVAARECIREVLRHPYVCLHLISLFHQPPAACAARLQAEVRRASGQGHAVVVFERSASVGGVWVYSDQSEEDDLGLKADRMRVHSSL